MEPLPQSQAVKGIVLAPHLDTFWRARLTLWIHQIRWRPSLRYLKSLPLKPGSTTSPPTWTRCHIASSRHNSAPRTRSILSAEGEAHQVFKLLDSAGTRWSMETRLQKWDHLPPAHTATATWGTASSLCVSKLHTSYNRQLSLQFLTWCSIPMALIQAPGSGGGPDNKRASTHKWVSAHKQAK
jgi:hypothetical protein